MGYSLSNLDLKMEDRHPLQDNYTHTQFENFIGSTISKIKCKAEDINAIPIHPSPIKIRQLYNIYCT